MVVQCLVARRGGRRGRESRRNRRILRGRNTSGNRRCWSVVVVVVVVVLGLGLVVVVVVGTGCMRLLFKELSWLT